MTRHLFVVPTEPDSPSARAWFRAVPWEGFLLAGSMLFLMGLAVANLVEAVLR